LLLNEKTFLTVYKYFLTHKYGTFEPCALQGMDGIPDHGHVPHGEQRLGALGGQVGHARPPARSHHHRLELHHGKTRPPPGGVAWIKLDHHQVPWDGLN
jgi:hypothetical protein